MKLNQLDVYFIQETWLEGDILDEAINGYHIFPHNGELGNHNFRGVAIILSPKYHKGWKAAGARPPITTDATGEFAGRFISTNIKLQATIVLENRCEGNKAKNTLPSPLLRFIIHAQRQVTMQRISASLTPSTLFLVKSQNNRKSSWAPTSTQTLAHSTICTPPNCVLPLDLMASPNATIRVRTSCTSTLHTNCAS